MNILNTYLFGVLVKQIRRFLCGYEIIVVGVDRYSLETNMKK